MLMNVALAGLMLVLTVVIHAWGMHIAMGLVRLERRISESQSHRHRIIRISTVVVLMFFVSLLEVLVYAVTYLAVNAIEGFEKALYFSMVTFSTLGYGDVVLADEWRLLASFEAANGIIMFGWTTAIVIAGVQKNYFPKE